MLNKLAAVSTFFGKTFALWVILLAVISYYQPDSFKFLAAYISILLGVVMFGMGLTLKPKDFSEVLTRPVEVLIGVVGQFVIMPVTAWVLCMLLNLPPEVSVGVILVGCCPGGTSSNVMTFLSRGDVALSVTITACTTLLAPFVTPALIYLFASQWVDVSIAAMFMSIVKIVLLPIGLGVALNLFFGSAVRKATLFLPLISVFAIVAIVCAVVAVSHERIAQTGLQIFAVVMLHNCLGYVFGFFLGKAFHLNLQKKKTLSIEIGMQNSGLGVALAMAHFNPVAAVPSAIFSVWHNISGPIVATIFNNMKGHDENKSEEEVHEEPEQNELKVQKA